MITQQSNYSDIANAHNQNTTAGNENISSVLSQIQDEGPAYTNPHVGSQRQDNLINLKSDRGYTTSGTQQSEMLINDTKQPDMPAAFIKNRNQDTPIDKKKTTTTWIQLSLILFVTLVVTFFMFRLDARTDQLEVSLSSHDDEVLDSIDSYTSELSPGFNSIKKTLKAVKQELELIRASTVPGAKVDSPVGSKSLTNEPLQRPSISDNIGIMDDEILALKQELKIAKDKLKAINANKTMPGNFSVAGKATATSVITTTGWVVNLASFTDRNKADKELEPLYAAGLSPLVQEANVNGRRIFRLIIDGFVSQADAKMFVRRADDEFGLQGGWIRKS